jgi:tetratricopeptide (TPR) repeat protein
MQFLIAWIGVFSVASVSLVFAQETGSLSAVQKLRLRGALVEAQQLAERELSVSPQDPRSEIELRLELARIFDRYGLHQNTRPVAAALEQIEAADSVAKHAGEASQAMVALARANYSYRAEMKERLFPLASANARRARTLFQHKADKHGEAEAVHLLGLIHLQRGENELAREHFEESLVLDREGGERVFFRGEYERHVGFVYLRSEGSEAAIPYFERSLACRKQAGAVDASLFAANSLASALVDVGRAEEAWPSLTYAMMVAEQLDSIRGKAMNGWALGQLYEQKQDIDAARIAYEMTIKIAESIGLNSISDRASQALLRLAAP